MPKLVILITTRLEKGLEVAEAWEAAGAPGATLIESHGLHNLRERTKNVELPLFVSMAQVLRQVEQTNQTLLCVVDTDSMVDRMMEIAAQILGDLHKPNTGIAFVLDVERTFGLQPSRPPSKPSTGE